MAKSMRMEGARRSFARLRELQKRAVREREGKCLVAGSSSLIREICGGIDREGDSSPAIPPVTLAGYEGAMEKVKQLGDELQAAALLPVTERQLRLIGGVQTVDVKDFLVAEVPAPMPKRRLEKGMEAQQKGVQEGRARRILVLDRIQDPGNVGTMLRSCVAFGWEHVIFGQGSADPLSDKVTRSSRGALHLAAPDSSLPVLTYERGGASMLQDLIRMHVDGDAHVQVAHTSGVALESREWQEKQEEWHQSKCGILVLSNEAKGVHDMLLEKGGPSLVSVPTAAACQSLNVATAAAILLHALRDR